MGARWKRRIKEKKGVATPMFRVDHCTREVVGMVLKWWMEGFAVPSNYEGRNGLKRDSLRYSTI